MHNKVDGVHSEKPAEKPGRLAVHDVSSIIDGALQNIRKVKDGLGNDKKDTKLIVNAINNLAYVQQFIKTLSYDGLSDLENTTSFPERISEGIHAKIIDSADYHGLFFAAIEMTRMPMIVTDPNLPDNPIIFTNQAFLNTTGYEAEDIIGRNCRFLQGDTTDKKTIAMIRKAIEDKTDIAVEIQNYRKDGTMFWNALFISPIFDTSGKLLYFFGSQLDVTRRREAENSLRRAQKMEAVGQLTGGIAHDFNNLLQIIIGNTQMAKMLAEQPARQSKHLDAIAGASEKARALTQQLLAFSRQQALESRIVNFNRVIADIKELLSKTLGEHIEMQLKLLPKLKNARVDVVQLELAIINILVNARDAMPTAGSVTIKTLNKTAAANDVSRDSVPRGEYVGIEISDTGCGMNAETLSHVTEPFYTTKEIGKGTGLGLAQVSGFVKQSEGFIEIESKEGEGTVVRLFFPVVDGRAEKTKDLPAKTLPQGKGETILLVEDNEQVRELANAILEHEGYTVLLANNAKKAIALFEKHPDIDMLFTDIVMPGELNGVSLAKELKSRRRNLSVLITTGFAEDTHGHTNSSEFEIIYKPYLPQDLANKMRIVLNRKNDHGN